MVEDLIDYVPLVKLEIVCNEDFVRRNRRYLLKKQPILG